MLVPVSVTRVLAFATKESARSSCRGGKSVAQRFLPNPLPSAAGTSTVGVVAHHRHRPISTSPLLRSKENGGGDGGDEISEKKKAIITRWMKWNTSKTWRYEPNRDLIALVGKGKSPSPLDQFRDLVPVEKRELENGAYFSVSPLRLSRSRSVFVLSHNTWHEAPAVGSARQSMRRNQVFSER